MQYVLTDYSNSFPRISNSFPRQSVLSNCNLFPRIGQVVLSDCNSFPRIRQSVVSSPFNSIWENGLSNSRERIAIRENEFSNSRERIAIRENGLSDSRERITNPWEGIAQFDITIFLCFFFNSHVPSGLSYKCIHTSLSPRSGVLQVYNSHLYQGPLNNPGNRTINFLESLNYICIFCFLEICHFVP